MCIRDRITIPLVANGDVTTSADAKAILEQSGADAVMIGRAHYGAPWVAGRIAAETTGTDAAGIPGNAEALADYVVAHYEDMLALYGVESGLRQARKHLGWYLDRHAPATDTVLRAAIMTGRDPKEVVAALRQAFAACAEEDMKDAA